MTGRTRARAHPNKTKHWAAILVERVRVEGRPTQRHVAYLGGVTDSAIEIAAQRMFFWDDVKQRLDRLSNRITAEDRKRIEAAIAAKVPPLTKKQREQCIRERQKFLANDQPCRRRVAALDVACFGKTPVKARHALRPSRG